MKIISMYGYGGAVQMINNIANKVNTRVNKGVGEYNNK